MLCAAKMAGIQEMYIFTITDFDKKVKEISKNDAQNNFACVIQEIDSLD
jgi:hypothetical protein